MKATLTFEWWRADAAYKQDVRPEDEEFLREEALGRATSLIDRGFTSGELHAFVGDEDEITYRGWWSLEHEQR